MRHHNGGGLASDSVHVRLCQGRECVYASTSERTAPPERRLCMISHIAAIQAQSSSRAHTVGGLAPFVLRGACPQCTPVEMNQIKKTLAHLQRNFPSEWNKLVQTYAG
uniref:Uncharacterized protein n=1 Tax=Anopheles maculatus TaxID=74869 RepID=A0A182SAP9_9DIPT